jgi:hypothetical protein
MKKTQLEEIGNANPFKVPEGYFENLSGRILSQLPEKVEQDTKVLSLWERIQPWVYMAAMFIGIALMVKMFVRKPSLDLTSSADIEEFYQYYEEQLAGKAYHETFYLDETNLLEDDQY